MPYTLVVGLAWFVAAFVLGLMIGIAMRSVAARRQVSRARSLAGQSTPSPEVERLLSRIAELEAELDRRTRVAAPADDPTSTPRTSSSGGLPPSPIERNDLTAIVGLGQNVAELCHGIGITTWSELAHTEVSLLRTLLDDAGPRYRVNDPTSWPEQARLLAEGRWDEFHTFAASVRAQRAPEPTGEHRDDTT